MLEANILFGQPPGGGWKVILKFD